MSDEAKQKPQDPDNVFIREKKDDPSTLIVFVPPTYRDAHAALKAAGARFVGGGNWSAPADDFRAAEQDVRAAARRDIELGNEGRKTREEGLRAQKEADKAARAEQTAENRAAGVAERDKSRVMVAVGSVSEGDTVSSPDGTEHSVARFGQEFEVTEEKVAEYNERFPGSDFKAGDKVVYAMFDQPEVDDSPQP